MNSSGRLPRSTKHRASLFLVILSCRAGVWKHHRLSPPLAAKVELGGGAVRILTAIPRRTFETYHTWFWSDYFLHLRAG